MKQESSGTGFICAVILRYFDVPDLTVLPRNGWRFINAVSDFATHAQLIRNTKEYQHNLFAKTIDGIRC